MIKRQRDMTRSSIKSGASSSTTTTRSPRPTIHSYFFWCILQSVKWRLLLHNLLAQTKNTLFFLEHIAISKVVPPPPRSPLARLDSKLTPLFFCVRSYCHELNQEPPPPRHRLLAQTQNPHPFFWLNITINKVSASSSITTTCSLGPKIYSFFPPLQILQPIKSDTSFSTSTNHSPSMILLSQFYPVPPLFFPPLYILQPIKSGTPHSRALLSLLDQFFFPPLFLSHFLVWNYCSTQMLVTKGMLTVWVSACVCVWWFVSV